MLPWEGGRFGRLEIAVIATALFVGGYAVQLASPSVDPATPVFVVVAILIASVTIASCTIVIERNDWRRRQGERTISQLVQRDALSGLYNRRFLKDQEESIVSFAKRKRYEMAVLMLDIDNFKSINDAHGHPVGDKVIRRIAGVIAERLRNSDIAIRYGGEEVLVILLDTELNAAVHVADELRGAVASLDFSDDGFRKLTISVGAAQVLSSLTEAVGRADAALYAAKQSGRNCVVADETDMAPARVAIRKGGKRTGARLRA